MIILEYACLAAASNRFSDLKFFTTCVHLSEQSSCVFLCLFYLWAGCVLVLDLHREWLFLFHQWVMKLWYHQYSTAMKVSYDG